MATLTLNPTDVKIFYGAPSGIGDPHSFGLDVTTGNLYYTINGTGIWTLVAATGAGTVTSVATGLGLSGGPITGSGTIVSSEAVNAQTGATYAILSTDGGKLVSFRSAVSVAVSIAAAGGSFPAGWYVDVANTSTGTVTITPTTSTIDGQSTLVLRTNQSVRIISDGSNYFVAFKGISGTFTVAISAPSVITTAVAVAGLPGSPVAGERAFVTDSNAASFTAGIGTVVAAGGTTAVPVVYDGTNWLIG